MLVEGRWVEEVVEVEVETGQNNMDWEGEKETECGRELTGGEQSRENWFPQQRRGEERDR